MLTRREFGKLGAVGVASITSGLNVSAEATSVQPANLDKFQTYERRGIHPNGTYWGHGEEKIDLLSGNLSFSIPLLHAQSRGANTLLRCSYNSHGADSEGQPLAHGWSLLIGALSSKTDPDGNIEYVYHDGTGAAFPLIPHEGNFISSSGQYFTWDAGADVMYFSGGERAEFAAVASEQEKDAGFRFPTRIIDTNGNFIEIAYQSGKGASASNTSGRPIAIYDARGMGGAPSYSFLYDKDAPSQLSGIESHVGTAESYTFGFSQEAVLDPLKGGNAVECRQLVQLSCSVGHEYSFSYNEFGELASASMPSGGKLTWDYGSFTFSDGRIVREVQGRSLVDPYSPSSASRFSLSRAGDTGGAHVHAVATLAEDTNSAKKVWTFNTNTADGTLGLTILRQTHDGAGRIIEEVRNDWALTPRGAPYPAVVTTVRDPGSETRAVSRVERVQDDLGNTTKVVHYGYKSRVKPEKTETYVYLSSAAYLQRHILNRRVSLLITDGLDAVATTYEHDSMPLVDAHLVPYHDPAFDSTVKIRGNQTKSSRQGQISTTTFDTTGMIDQTQDSAGVVIKFVLAPGTNNTQYASMSRLGSSEYATHFEYSAGKMIAKTTPNGTSTWTRDAFGRVTEESLVGTPAVQISYGQQPSSVTRTVAGQSTKKVHNGFGQHIVTEKRDGAGVTTTTLYEYAPSSLAPNGKLARASLPYSETASPIWVDYTHDVLGRIVERGSRVSAGKTTMTRAGAVTTITDGLGNWKQVEHNISGKVVAVVQPNLSGGANLHTQYAYNLFGNLTSVSLPRLSGTQQRKFDYDANGRLIQRVEPESGRERRSYNADGTLAEIIDAKGQQKIFARDSLKRLTSVKRYTDQGRLIPAESVNYFYDSNPFDAGFAQNPHGRLTAVQWGTAETLPGLFTEMYSYSPSGKEVAKRLSVTRGGKTVSLTSSRIYDENGRQTSLSYPEGPTVLSEYDPAGRPISLRIESQSVVQDARYTATGQLTSAKILASSDAGYMVVTKMFNERNRVQRITSSPETAAGEALIPKIDLEYTYSPASGKLEKELNHVDGTSVSYSYDGFGRLATTALNPASWGLKFQYDDFGNRADQMATSGASYQQSYRHSPDTNHILSPDVAYDPTGNIVRLPSVSIAYDTQGRISQIATEQASTTLYGYDPQGMRIWTKSDVHETISFYSIGKRLATYNLSIGKDGSLSLSLRDANVFLGQRLMRSGTSALLFDRIGAVRGWADSTQTAPGLASYLPFGELASSGAAQGSFGPYDRDPSGLDYAEQRFYASQVGRFVSPDPLRDSVRASDPLSWNRYTYAGNDPINHTDRHGMDPNNAVSQSTTFADGSSQQTYVTHDASDPDHGTIVTVTIVSPDQVTDTGDVQVAMFVPSLLQEAGALASMAAIAGKSLDIISSSTAEATIDYSLSSEIAGGAAVEIATEASVAALATALGIGLGAGVAIFILAAGAYYLYEKSK